ncbi:hypothetical protein Y032_0147g2605 [Ancylostoma ceylanicum]|nr:hypothetical protein Y032_0147g2605 [Ancylostoma ceylanicum]
MQKDRAARAEIAAVTANHKEKIRDQLLNEIRNERARHIQEKIVQSYFLDKRFDQRRELRERNHFELAAKRARLSIPLIVHQLSQDQIDADIRTADLAVLISDVKDDEGKSSESSDGAYK